MSDSRGFRAGDERLGRVLRDAVEGRGRPVSPSPAGAGAGPRAFVAATERRAAGERPRFGAIAVAAVAGAVVATGLALWPALTGQRAPAAGQRDAGQAVLAGAARAAPAAAPASASAATAALPSTPAPAASAAPIAAAPAAAGAAGPPAAGTAIAVAAQPPPAPPAAGARPPQAATPPGAAPLPPLTFAHRAVVGCCQALGGRWHDLVVGGAPGFHGPSAWTAGRAATAIWSLGSPAGGRRWDAVRVLIWIPNRHASARVRFTVTATAGRQRTVRAFDVAEPGRGGWLAIPGTFAAGTPAGRTGTITVRMSFLRPSAGADMAAGQAMFEWS